MLAGWIAGEVRGHARALSRVAFGVTTMVRSDLVSERRRQDERGCDQTACRGEPLESACEHHEVLGKAFVSSWRPGLRYFASNYWSVTLCL